MSLDLSGIIAAIPTPYDEDGEVSREKLLGNIEQWNKSDIIGYLALGSTGEFPHLTVDEKLAVIETTRQNMSREMLLLVGTGELSTRGNIEMAKRAHDYGADAVLVITPFYYKRLLEEEHHIDHYRRIADNSPIPVIIYNIPQFAGVSLLPETIALLAEHPNIIGLKESSGDIHSLKEIFRELKSKDFNVMLGSPAIYSEGIEMGARGGILAVASLVPDLCVELDRASRNGNHEYAQNLQRKLSKLARVTSAAGIGHLKAAMDLKGLYGFLPRSPLPIPTEVEMSVITEAMKELNIETSGNGDNEFSD